MAIFTTKIFTQTNQFLRSLKINRILQRAVKNLILFMIEIMRITSIGFYTNLTVMKRAN